MWCSARPDHRGRGVLPGFTRLPYFKSLAVPASIGISVALLAHPGAGHPDARQLPRGVRPQKRAMRTQGWRRIGTAVVRWPGRCWRCRSAWRSSGWPRCRATRPATTSGLPAAGHAVQRRLRRRRTALLRRAAEPQLLMIEVRPRPAQPGRHADAGEGSPRRCSPRRGGDGAIHHPAAGHPAGPSSIPFQMSMQGATQLEALPFQQARAQDLLTQVNEISNSIDLLKRQMALQQQLSDATNNQAKEFPDTGDAIRELRDKIANVDDFLRPIRNTSTGNRTATTSPVCYVPVAVRRARRRRPAQRPVRQDLGRPGSNDRAAAARSPLIPRAAGHPGNAVRRWWRTTIRRRPDCCSGPGRR